MPTGAPSRFAIRYGLVQGAVDTQAVFDGMYAASPASFWLDSNSAGDESARFSFLGDDRGPLSETVISSGGTVRVRDRRGVRVESGDLSGVLDARLADRWIGPTCLPFEFVGGYVGYSRPERGRTHDVEPAVPATRNPGPAAIRKPDAIWMFADRIVVVDHQAGLTYLLAVEDGRLGVRIAADAWIVDTMRRMHGLPPQLPAADPPPTLSAVEDQSSEERVQDRYRRLRRSHPAPYAALLRFGEVTLTSGAAGSALQAASPLAAGSAAHRPEPALATGPVPASAAACLRRGLLAEPAAGVPHESASGATARPELGGRPTSLGYFGLAGGVDLSLVTSLAIPRATAATPRRSDCPAAGDVEPAA